MSSLDPQAETLEPPTPSDSSIDNKFEQDSLESKNLEQGEKDREGEEGEGEGEEGEGECGFCLFMKAGGCRESFTAWENCLEEAEKNKEDVVDKCSQVTGALTKCMEAHADYYEPILMGLNAAEEKAKMELEKEKNEKELENENKADRNVTE